MQLASWNPPSEDKLLLIRQVFARLTGPLPSKCTLTFAHSFAELSRKDPTLSAGPSHQQGGKENTRGLGVWLSQSLTFGSLAAAFGACSLRLPKPTLVQVLQDHGIWLTFGSLAATYGAVQKKLPDRGRQEVVALNKL